MIDVCIELLRNGLAGGEGGVLTQSDVAKELLNLLLESGEDILENNYPLREIGNSVNVPGDELINRADRRHLPREKDLRFKSLHLKNFRKFPEPKEAAYWELPFMNSDGEPISCVFLGANGSGKTSLYTALEHCNLGTASAGEVRGYQTQPEMENYLAYADKEYNNIYLSLSMNEAGIAASLCQGNLQFPLKNAYPFFKAFFCSERDIIRLESNEDKALRDFIYSQTGYSSLAKLIEKLDNEAKFINDEIYDADVSGRISVYDVPLSIEYRNAIMEVLTSVLVTETAKQQQDKTFAEDYKKLLEAMSVKYESYDGESLDDIRRWLEGYKKYLEGIIGQVLMPIKSRCEKLSEMYDAELQRTQVFLDKFIDGPAEMSEFESFMAGSVRFDEVRDRLCCCLNKTLRFLDGGKRLHERVSFISQVLTAFAKIDKTYFKESGEDSANYRSRRDHYEQLANEFRIISLFFKGILNERLKKMFDKEWKNIKDVVEAYMQPYEKFGFRISPVSGNELAALNAEIQLVDEKEMPIGSPMLPRKYFNTFRFKLYGISLKFALSFAVKSLFKINFPIIVDDVFDSSDFPNRIEIKRFIGKMVRKHNELFPDGEMPLQIIYFTQDEVTARAVYKGIKSENGSNSVKLSRICDFREVESSQTSRSLNVGNRLDCKIC